MKIKVYIDGKHLLTSRSKRETVATLTKWEFAWDEEKSTDTEMYFKSNEMSRSCLGDCSCLDR